MIRLLLFCLLTISYGTHAQEALRKKEFNIKSSLAIQGYDPVAYFSGRAKMGSKANAVSHQGILYYFSSAEHKELFKANPSKYEPQYGGWCAYAMGATGEKVDVDPETFKITDGKLYLFYNRLLNNTLKSWNKNESNLKTEADRNWAKILK